MSERFTKLLSLPPDLYAEGSPLIVSAGNLLKDNQTGQVLVQLKIKNISPKTVKAATVAIRALDTMGRPIEGDAAKEYLDLSVRQGEEFGQKAAIPLPNPSTRGVTVAVQEVVFADNSAYEGTDAPWEPLPAATPLTRTLEDLELVKQYELTFGGPCQVTPQEHKNLWQCACGAWNREGTCYACRKGKSALFSLDLESLKADKNARLVREKAEREAQAAAEKAAAEQAAAEAAARAKKTKKLLAILIPAAVLCLAAILLITQVLIPNSNYKKAMALLDAGQYEEAIAAFEALDGYKDSEKQIDSAKAAIAEQERLKAEQAQREKEAKAEQERLEQQAKAEQERLAAEAKVEGDYAAAVALYAAGKYEEAIAAFDALDGYKDSTDQIIHCEIAIKDEMYDAAKELYASEQYKEAISAFTALDGYKDSDGYRGECLYHLIRKNTIAAGGNHTVGIKADGTVIAVGSNIYSQSNVSAWKSVVAVAAGTSHTVGLNADGTVIAVGDKTSGRCDISDWESIVAVAAGFWNTVGLKADATVVVVGNNDYGQCNVSDWNDIIAVSSGSFHTVGLKANGTVVATLYTGHQSQNYGQCNVSDWKDIVSIAAGYAYTVGLKADGTVIAIGRNAEEQCDVSGWKNIVAISAGGSHTVGLKADGTVVAVGNNSSGQCDVSEWKDIVAIAAGAFHTVGLKADGTVIATGKSDKGQCDVSGWTDIRVPER